MSFSEAHDNHSVDRRSSPARIPAPRDPVVVAGSLLEEVGSPTPSGALSPTLAGIPFPAHDINSPGSPIVRASDVEANIVPLLEGLGKNEVSGTMEGEGAVRERLDRMEERQKRMERLLEMLVAGKKGDVFDE
jgi:hypothetical protein